MKLSPSTNFITLRNGQTTCSFLPSGSLRELLCGPVMVNQFRGTALDGAVSGLWLQLYREDGLHVYPMTGLFSGSAVSYTDTRLIQRGEAEGVRWEVTFLLASENAWLWNVRLSGEGKADVVYGQDLGMGSKGGVLTNELYISQYLGHTIFESEHGYTVCSRQNQPQPGCPSLRQGMIRGRAIHYSTDGTQFYGLSSKRTGEIAALKGDLCDQNLQFEFAYTALQSEAVQLLGEASFTFYGVFAADHPDAIREPEYDDQIEAALRLLTENDPAAEKTAAPMRRAAEIGAPYCSPQWDEETVQAVYGARILEERQGETLLSFFTPDYAHVALQQKELLVERPHGTIILSGIRTDAPDERVLASTSYMYGLFAGQVIIGNTNLHKLLSTPRGLLNLQHHPGMRIYLKQDGCYRLLTLPAAYEMGRSHARWYYELPDDRLVVTAYTSMDAPDMVIRMESLSGKKYEALVTMQLVMGDNEYDQPIWMEQKGDTFHFTADESFMSKSVYPELHYDLTVLGDYALTGDGVFFADGVSQEPTLLTLHTNGDFSVLIHGALEAEPETAPFLPDFSAQVNASRVLFDKLKAGFHITLPGNEALADKLNAIAQWYTHNAMVHFASPHGLEQPGGAAWGTRDVCQGPFEYFLMTGNGPMMRATLLRIFAHQQLENGEWPQWFMFDRYTANAGECHGDVVFWPLKCIGDYLLATGDYTVLDEPLPYAHEQDGAPTEQKETLLQHVQRAVTTVFAGRFLPGTALVTYAGGDWDDTLQPADPAMKKRLVSAWTQALAYQVLLNLSKALLPADSAFADTLRQKAEEIRQAFAELLTRNGVIAGFVRQEDDGTLTPMLHPDDTFTGIHYRLLPMTRSIIAEMANAEQAGRNMELIDTHLACPDGVRLMDHPTHYDGGVSHLFRRAEQAANVGREISLQYTHAHIRYVESLAKLGRAEQAWDALLRVTPIGLSDIVKNALPRQSNLYFSSSDGCFPDRYSYSEGFNRLRNGSVEVKGGWRLYSSGPGIYLHQLVSALLGLRFEKDSLVLDPVLSRDMDGLTCTFRCYNKEHTFVYRFDGRNGLFRDGKALAAEQLHNRYRAAGWKLSRAVLEASDGVIEVCLG